MTVENVEAGLLFDPPLSKDKNDRAKAHEGHGKRRERIKINKPR
jgi:hypothetical protein